MTTFGQKLLSAAQEGIAKARGEAKPGTYRIHLPPVEKMPARRKARAKKA